jgi:glycosyltransferase involved in cell wall biosynthesis
VDVASEAVTASGELDAQITVPVAATQPLFSLIVSTLGRGAPLRRLFLSLESQRETRFEVIVVDQNDDAGLVGAAISGSWRFPVRHLHRPGMRGLSRGRNAGIAHAAGELLVFPDDDCWYPADFLSRALGLVARHDVALICGRAADETGRSINGRFETASQALTRANVWTTSIEWVQVYRTAALRAVGGYDEDIGIGASTPWQAAEGQDLALRLLAAGYDGYYDPTFIGHHEELDTARPDAAMLRKMRAYGRGMGFVLRKNGYRLGAAKWIARPLGGLVLAAMQMRPGRARLFLQILRGRIEGYVGRGD